MAEVISVNQVQELSQQLHQQHKTIVIGGGCFDLLHIGHITYLQQAKKQGDVLMVLLESDASTKKKKGINRPIHTQQQRATMLASISAVDYVVMLADDMKDTDYEKLTQDIHPSVIAITTEDPFEDKKRMQAEHIGAKLIPVNTLIPSISTSTILAKLLDES